MTVEKKIEIEILIVLTSSCFHEAGPNVQYLIGSARTQLHLFFRTNHLNYRDDILPNGWSNENHNSGSAERNPVGKLDWHIESQSNVECTGKC